MVKVYDRLGSWVIPGDLKDLELGNTPQYDPFENETQKKQSFPQLAGELEPMPEVEDFYTGSKWQKAM